MRPLRASGRALTLLVALAAAVLLAAAGVLAAVEHAAVTSAIPDVTTSSGSSSMGLYPPVVVRRPPPRTTATTLRETAPPTRATPPVPAAACSAPPLAKPAAGLVVGRVTAIGDSVMMDIESAFKSDEKGAAFDAYVGQQWYEGVSDVGQLRAHRQLGSIVVIELGTNGPIDSGDFTEMMQQLRGVSRVVFVTNFVPLDWQGPNNAVIEAGARRYRNVVVANWERLAAANPHWFYGDGPHMPEGGPGAHAMARLIAGCV